MKRVEVFQLREEKALQRPYCVHSVSLGGYRKARDSFIMDYRDRITNNDFKQKLDLDYIFKRNTSLRG